jgi:uncharacterized protein DUF4915
VPLLISCLGEQTGGGLFTYDGKTVEQLDTLSSTGLAVADDRFGRLLWSSGEAGSVGELLVYDEVGVARYFRIDALREPHDLAWDGDAFVAVSTMSNSVVWLSPSGEVSRTWQADGNGDAWHLNSVFPVDGRLVAAAFGRFSRHREWSDGRAAGTGIVFDLATGEDIVKGLSCPHDPRLVDGLWLICNSARKELIAVEPTSGTVRHRVQLEGWTRGLTVHEDLVYVGESANRAIPVPGELASVAVIDRRTWLVINRLPLPCQEVFDMIHVPQALARGVRQGSARIRFEQRSKISTCCFRKSALAQHGSGRSAIRYLRAHAGSAWRRRSLRRWRQGRFMSVSVSSRTAAMRFWCPRRRTRCTSRIAGSAVRKTAK